MALRDEAIAAKAAADAARQEAARGVLASRLSPAEVTGLTVEAMTADVVVFADDSLCLAVRDVGPSETAVFLVESNGAGGWTRLGAVPSLPVLGALLDQGTPA